MTQKNDLTVLETALLEAEEQTQPPNHLTKDPEVNAPEELPALQMPPAKAQVTFPDRDAEKTSLEE